jgi:hypothetical protein
MGTDAAASSSRRIFGILRPDLVCAAASAGVCSPGSRSDSSGSDGAAADAASGAAAGGASTCSGSAREGKGLGLRFRLSRFRVVLVLAAAARLTRGEAASLFVRLGLARFALATGVLRRGVLTFLRVARRTARPAGFTACSERGFFVFMPGNDPFGGCRILSDTLNSTAASWLPQRESVPLEMEVSRPGARGTVGQAAELEWRPTRQRLTRAGKGRGPDEARDSRQTAAGPGNTMRNHSEALAMHTLRACWQPAARRRCGRALRGGSVGRAQRPPLIPRCNLTGHLL